MKHLAVIHFQTLAIKVEDYIIFYYKILVVCNFCDFNTFCKSLNLKYIGTKVVPILIDLYKYKGIIYVGFCNSCIKFSRILTHQRKFFIEIYRKKILVPITLYLAQKLLKYFENFIVNIK